MRRPRRIAQAFTLVPGRELEQPLERSRRCVNPLMAVAHLRKALGHRGEREVSRLGALHLVPPEWRGDAGIGRRPHRVGRGHRAVFGVLIVVYEHAVTLFFPPFAGRDRGRPALHVARQGERRAADFIEAPPSLDAHDDVHAAGARGLRPAREPDVL